MIVQAIQCDACQDVIYSRAHHDYHHCTCGAINVDGGFEYMRFGWKDDEVNKPEPFELKVLATKEELYQDWNKRTDKFGTVKLTNHATG